MAKKRITHRRTLSPFQRKLQNAVAEAALERFAPSDNTVAPTAIYHYTDPKGLVGILSDGQLWATDIRYLNDSSELLYAQQVHARVLAGIAAASSTLIEKSLAERAQSSYSALAVGVKHYVVCFSEHDDLLTQWKTYGSWGAGFSIGFDRVRLERAFNPPMTVGDLMKSIGVMRPETRLVKVKYADDTQSSQLRRAFARFASILDHTCSEPDMQECASAIADNVALSASQFKHPGFSSEAEWRLMIATIFAGRYAFETDELCFRASSRTVIPYLKTTRQPNGTLPIISITIGPTLHRSLSEQSVTALLRSKGYSDVRVKASTLPLTRID
jgi:hypothetical protein